jgi:ribosomal protein L11 methyltransferase
MTTSYLAITLACPAESQDMAIALLLEEGFETFIQEDSYMVGYIPAADFNATNTREVLLKLGLPPDFEAETVETENWNARWEADYAPVEVDALCLVYPPFKQPNETERHRWRHCIQIQPQMSFGTGHHETTRLMLRLVLTLPTPSPSSRALDAGCGTGVLGIAAGLHGYDSVVFLDNDPICIENTGHNLALNPGFRAQWDIQLGSLETLAPTEENRFDLCIANIQRNVLLSAAPCMPLLVTPGGRVLLSGFFTEDVAPLIAAYQATAPWQVVEVCEDNHWAAIHLVLE